MIGCNCNAGLSNTGRPGCVPVFGITSSMILVPLKANDGTLNGIDLNATLPVWSDLINEVDASKRWFPLPAFENVELAKADSQFEESNSGRKAFLRQGTRSFSGELWAEDSTPTLLGKLYNVRCVDFGIYIVDVNGNLIGSEMDGYLYPIPVDNASWDPKFMFATDSAVQKIMLAFDIDRLFNEATMYQITATEGSQDFTKLEGLIDVNLLNLTITSTDVTFDAKLDYGTALNKILFKGALLTDFALYNNTTASVVVLSGIQEIADGKYTLTFPAQTAGDSLTLSIDKTGYDGEVTFLAV
jgi:hypothetical protein